MKMAQAIFMGAMESLVYQIQYLVITHYIKPLLMPVLRLAIHTMMISMEQHKKALVLHNKQFGMAKEKVQASLLLSQY